MIILRNKKFSAANSLLKVNKNTIKNLYNSSTAAKKTPLALMVSPQEVSEYLV